MIHSKATRAFPAQKGFALVVTLSLMILLTVIAVGLLTLSSVTLRSSSQGQAAAEARANARLALMMAIGELQKEMGPDSRISAPQDAGTSPPPGGQPHWTAVYDAWSAATPGAAETPDSRSVKFRGWLASGTNPATGGTADKVQLVGDRSLGRSPGDTAPPDDLVSVPTYRVSTGNQRGQFAWWTADEAAKAKVNAGPDATDKSSFGISDPLFAAQSPPNTGHRAFPKLEQLVWKEGKRAATISTAQVNLAAELGTPGLGNFSHDLTVSSAGVLADVRSGRLKRDLSNLLAPAHRRAARQAALLVRRPHEPARHLRGWHQGHQPKLCERLAVKRHQERRMGHQPGGTASVPQPPQGADVERQHPESGRQENP